MILRLSTGAARVSCYGENLTYFCDDAKEVLLQIIVDDGHSEERFHRNNLFSDRFHVMGCYTGEHAALQTISCINYCGDYIGMEEECPITRQMKMLNEEDVLFDER